MIPEALVTPHGPTRAERAALRAVQAGAVLAVLVAATYKTFELDRFYVPKELVLHLTALVAGLLCVGAARRAAVTWVDVLLLAFLALGAASAALATNPWWAARALGVAISGVVLFWVGRVLRQAGLGRPLLVALAVAAVLTAVTALAQTYGVRTDFFSLNRAPGGTLGNRNSIAHVAAFGLPLVLLSGLRAWRTLGFLFSAVGLAALAAALFLTRSRAAWLALVVVILVLAVGWFASRPVRRDRRAWLRMFALLSLGAGGVAAAFALPNTLRWASDSPYLETARGVVNYEEGSGRGRLIQYRNTLRMALDHPLLGVGPGNWPVVYPEYAQRRDPSLSRDEPGTTSNPWPSSDWVAFVATYGLPAFALLVLALLGIAAGGWRRLRTARDAEEGFGALALLAMLAGVAVVGAFDASLLLAWPTLIVWTAMGALWSPELARPLGVAPPARAAALLLLALLAGASALRTAGQLAAMAIYAEGAGRERLELAARLDPGNYRVRTRLAREYGRRSPRRCEHALAARALLPNAEGARSLARRCD